jgi:hypothetical protein
VLNLDENGLLVAGCKAICDVLKSNTTVTSFSMKKNGFQAKSAQAIAEMLSDNGALLVLSLSDNRLGTKEVGEVLGEMLNANSVLKELDVSSNNAYQGDPAGFAQGISKGLPGNGALSTVTMYKFPLLIQDIKTKIELNFSGKELCSLDAIVIAALLPLNVSGTQFGDPIIADISLSVGKGAMTSLNLASNSLGVEGAKIVAAFLPKCT